MSGETFERNWPAIGAALEMLAENPKSRRRWRLLAVYDERSTLVAEVIRTQHGPVVVMQTAVQDGADRIRQDRKRDVEPLTGDPAQWFVVTSRHGQYALDAGDVVACIRDGATTFVLGRGKAQR